MNIMTRINTIKEKKEESEFSQNIYRMIKGSICAILITLLLLFVFSMVLTYTNIGENMIQPVVIIITALSILIGSSISAKKIKKNGIINGAFVGFIYILAIYIISSIAISGFAFNMSCLVMMIAAILAGMLGGIIGVNLK